MIFDNLLTKLTGRKITYNYLSHVPGSWIDDIYTEEPATWVGKTWRFIKAKLIFLTLFLPLAAINFISNGLTSIVCEIASLFSSGKNKASWRSKAWIAFDNSMKNLLGIIFFPIGIIFTREFSFLFISKPIVKDTVTAGGSYIVAKTQLEKPSSISEVQDIIKKALALSTAGQKQQIIVRGAGASQGQQFLPKDSSSIVIDLSKLNEVAISPDKQTITVGAGATWGEIEQIIAAQGLAIEVRQASNIFSVGGTLSANAHGWAHKSGSIINTIESIKVINANGELLELRPEDELFGYVIGGWGMFGVIVEAKIRVAPNQMLKEQGKALNVNDYIGYYKSPTPPAAANDAHNIAAPLDSNTKMHLFRLSLDPRNLLKEGVAVQYVAMDDVAHKVEIESEAPHGTRFQRVMTNIARYFGTVRRLYWRMESQRIINGQEPPLTRAEHMQAPIRAMFNYSRSEAEWLQEYFIPEDKLSSFLSELGDLLMENNVSLLNASVRPVVHDKISKLGYANKGPMYAVVLCFNQKLDASSRLQTRRWVKKANDIALKHAGTYYLAYQPFATHEQFAKSYPQYQSVWEKKKQADPSDIFESGFMAKYFTPESFNPYDVVCKDDNTLREFDGFLKNILVEIDPEKFNVLIKDIMSYADTNEDIFKELHRRIGEIAPGFFTSTSRVLESLRAIKEDLSNQAYELMQAGPKRERELNGILEIGYPGRFLKPIIKKLGVKGDAQAMQENFSMTDVMQSGFPRAHSKAHKLDFNKPDFSGMQDNSFDVVTCFVGLHHFDNDALKNFLVQLNRVMRKDGSFLLVDHDVTDEKSRAMATLAHSVFNAVKGASLAEEFDEVREFRSLNAWKAILAQYGFAVVESPRPMIREGDPSLNTMLRFIKVADVKLENVPEIADIRVSDAGTTPRTNAPHPAKTQRKGRMGFAAPSARIFPGTKPQAPTKRKDTKPSGPTKA